ncbi:MAG: alkaline phosphatase family protein [Vicinamibacterales bacterium]
MKVLLLVIDAATPHVMCPAVRTGRLPVLQRLADAGTMLDSSVSIFPSITPAATTSIATGAYPAEHGIAGASWYDQAREEIAYYGDDFWVIAREGFGQFIRDFLLRLNGERLRAPTLFQMVERSGRTAACLNYLVFRGDHPHRVRIPGVMAALPGVPLAETVEGPSVLALGDFVGTPSAHGRKLREKGGPFHRFGMDDASTGSMLRDLFASGRLPDLTVAYFADNDYRSHEVGPHAALPVIERIDRMLGEAFDAAGGINRALADLCVVLTSDHGHCDVLPDAEQAAIRLDRLLGNFRQAELGKPWRDGDKLMICPNMRAAQIYLRAPVAGLVEQIAQDLLLDHRIDQVIWRTGHPNRELDGYTVLSARGRLEFSKRPEGSDALADGFGGHWECRGDVDALDLQLDGSTLEFEQYPNAFERIAGILDLDQSGDLWVTARPGCEFEVPGGKAHVGGASHGALHALDSFSPVILAGGPVRPRLPRHMRSIDIAPVCMELLGLPMRYQPGMPRGVHTLESSRR